MRRFAILVSLSLSFCWAKESGLSYNAGVVKCFVLLFFTFFPHCCIHSEMSAISLS